MKKIKKLLSVLLAVSIAATAMLAFAAFEDVSDPYVELLTEKGIIKGYSEETFAPDNDCTRGQFLTFLWRATGEPSAEKVEKITDITGDEYYAEAVWWAYENGITKIYSDNTFRADAAVDYEHAAYYLYNWAKLYEKADMTKTLTEFKYLEDGAQILPECNIPFAWAVASGFIVEDDTLHTKPKEAVNRLWSVNTIGKILETHLCKWSEWKDNGDGTHTRVCEKDAAHKETKEHFWNDGELTIAPTETEKGFITYTCHDCKLTKTEEAAAGTKFTTRADAEEALVSTAFAYYSKGIKVQYDSTHFTELTALLGGHIRLTAQSAPEVATKDRTFYSVCSDYSHQVYYDSLGVRDMGNLTWHMGYSTEYLFRYADNQPHRMSKTNDMIEPLTEEDVDACLYRWVHYDEYAEYKGASVINKHMGAGVFESSSFTDYTTGLTFKEDGYEGEIHYSYYDEEGNVLEGREVREKYLDPINKNPDEHFRPGDLLVDHSHTMVYVGNDRLLDCGGSKLSTKTGEDKIEANGAIRGYKSFAEISTGANRKSLILMRPLELLVKMGYDEDPGNDIIKDLVIPEKTKSRIKYPMMDIDRTVDITEYGTVVTGENLTYNIEIFNKTNDENYGTFTGEGAAVDYSNIVVTEKVPEGTELVAESIVGGGKYENGIITWNIEKIASGESAKLGYSVKVTAPIGSVIVNNGGMVDNIPSNTLKNTVGGEKLEERQAALLAGVSASGADTLKKFGEDTAFANGIYAEIGEELKLPAAEEIMKGLFEVTGYVAGYAENSSWVPLFSKKHLFIYKDEVTEEFKDIKSMVVDTFWGGRRFFGGESRRWDSANNSIKEFRKEYLEAGDIIVYVEMRDTQTLEYNFKTVGVMVYDGTNILTSIKTPEGTTYEVIDEANITPYLTKLFMTDKHVFFNLRPSQAK